MRKSVITLMAVLILFIFAACIDTQSSGSQASASSQSTSSGWAAADGRAQTSQSTAEVAPSLPARSAQSQSAVVKGKVEKNATSSQLDEINSTLNSLKELTDNLDDVTSEDTDIS